jgi:CheY-like chemotaxis protein/anti-sigma regulatory factor (Ser/Thr protein kinase)
MANVETLREVFLNLIINAVDAMPDGGRIVLSAEAEGDAVVVRVRDTGVGMSADIRRHCMEPFFTTKGEKGSGLGLSLCYGVVQRHGGVLQIESEVGQGTTVIVRLPRGEGSARAPDVPATVTPRPARPRRLLVIDDDEMGRDLMSMYLRSDGHTVETAAGGVEGLRMFREDRFDLVVTDRAMAGMGGDQVAAEIKRIAPGVPVIMVTGFGDLMLHRRETPPGVDLLVGKPVTQCELRDAIRRVGGDGEFPEATLVPGEGTRADAPRSGSAA